MSSPCDVCGDKDAHKTVKIEAENDRYAETWSLCGDEACWVGLGEKKGLLSASDESEEIDDEEVLGALGMVPCRENVKWTLHSEIKRGKTETITVTKDDQEFVEKKLSEIGAKFTEKHAENTNPYD